MSTVATRRFTVDEYVRMAETGILRPDERVELIEGEIVEMGAIGPPHAGHVNRLTARLVPLLAGRSVVAVQNPVVLSDITAPQPDLAVLEHRDDFYAGGHARPAAILLAIEVADSSLAYDRRVKAPLYARSGVPELWIVDVAVPRILVHRDPGPDGYRSVITAEASATLTVAGVALEVASLLG